jgi:hypothetical protein
VSGAVTFSRSLLLLSRSLPMGETRHLGTDRMHTHIPTHKYTPRFAACQRLCEFNIHEYRCRHNLLKPQIGPGNYRRAGIWDMAPNMVKFREFIGLLPDRGVEQCSAIGSISIDLGGGESLAVW